MKMCIGCSTFFISMSIGSSINNSEWWRLYAVGAFICICLAVVSKEIENLRAELADKKSI